MTHTDSTAKALDHDAHQLANVRRRAQIDIRRAFLVLATSTAFLAGCLTASAVTRG